MAEEHLTECRMELLTKCGVTLCEAQGKLYEEDGNTLG